MDVSSATIPEKRVRRAASGVLALVLLALAGAGCATTHKEGAPLIPVVKLSETPPAVRATILSAAQGNRLDLITRVKQFEGPLFRAYIHEPAGPRLLAVNEHGRVLEDATVVPMEELPPAVQASAHTAVSGRLIVCRKSQLQPEPTYIIDYLVGEDEPVFAIIRADGFVRAVFGYAEEDPD